MNDAETLANFACFIKGSNPIAGLPPMGVWLYQDGIVVQHFHAVDAICQGHIQKFVSTLATDFKVLESELCFCKEVAVIIVERNPKWTEKEAQGFAHAVKVVLWKTAYEVTTIGTAPKDKIFGLPVFKPDMRSYVANAEIARDFMKQYPAEVHCTRMIHEGNLRTKVSE